MTWPHDSQPLAQRTRLEMRVLPSISVLAEQQLHRRRDALWITWRDCSCYAVNKSLSLWALGFRARAAHDLVESVPIFLGITTSPGRRRALRNTDC